MMKRYEIEHVAPYADDQGCVFENPVETADGDWVPADVAQGLYDALDELMTAWFSPDDDLRDKAFRNAREALKAADGGES